MDSLSGQRALITGAARGIGLRIAETFADAGAHIIVQDVNAEGAEATAATLRANGAEALAVAGSVSNPDDVTRAFTRADEAFGRVDILVNNAGISESKPTLEMTVADWDHTIDINLRGAFLCALEAGRRMTMQGSGVIINMASIYGVVAAPGRLSYAVSKTGLVAMTKVLAVEWAQKGVRVNAIAPGYTRTPLLMGIIEQGQVDADAVERRTPMGRLAKPQEIADLALFLASSRAAFITGQVVAVDGGWTAYGYI